VVPKIVEVTWHDTHSESGGWQEPHLVARNVAAPFVVRSVGFLLRADNKCVILAQTRTTDGRVTDTITVPRGVVRRIKQLR